MKAIRIYQIQLDADSAALDRCFDLLPAGERVRATRFRSPLLRNRFVMCRGTLRQILADHLGGRPSTIPIHITAHGKPFVPGSKLGFNVARSGDRAIAAVVMGRRVGVDIERIDPGFASLQAAARFLSPSELAELRRLPERHRARGFFRCWTCKEAYLKAVGLAVSIPLDGFDVSIVPGEPAPVLRGVTGYSLYTLDLDPGFAVAVAAEGTDWQPVLMPTLPPQSYLPPHYEAPAARLHA